MVFNKLRVILLTLICVSGVAAADETSPSPAAPLDDAALAALGIERPVETDDGSWSWTEGPYVYDGAGNITAIGTQSFVYDSRNRLVSATLTRPDQPGFQTHTYSYDAMGNMISRTAATPTAIPMATSIATNHLTGLGATYDDAGNITQLQPPRQPHTYQYAYDAVGSLQRVSVVGANPARTRYNIYTADDERLWTYDGPSNTSRWTIRDLSGKVLRDYTFDWVASTTPPGAPEPRWRLSRDYIYRDGMLLAAITADGPQYFSLDHLGTPRVITDANRYRVGFHHYLPFGEEWLVDPQPSDAEPMKYTGHERDLDLAGGTAATDYMHARHYVAGVGRFLSRDPIDGSPEFPQSWNAYSYVINSPIAHVDPAGMEAQRAEVVATSSYDCGAREGLDCFTFGPRWSSEDLRRRSDAEIERAKIDFLAKVALWSRQYRAGYRESQATVWDRFGRFTTPRTTADAAIVLAGVLPLGVVARLVKAIRPFDPQQRALVALAKHAQRFGVTKSEAMELIKWAKEYDVPYQNHIGTTHWVGGPHIRIGPVNHIPVY